MWPVSIVLLSLVAGFLAGHGFELPVDLVPLIIAVVVGYFAISATGLLSDQQ